MTPSPPKKIAIAGSTGSVGRQALQVISSHSDSFSVAMLCARNNVDLLIRQAIQHRPQVVIIANTQHHKKLLAELDGLPIEVLAGEHLLGRVADLADFDLLLNALTGIAGLEPALHAVKNQKVVAMANKECLVAGGELLMHMAKEHHTPILPVDSEHSAIFQCLQGEPPGAIEKVYLTASGGPFRGMKRADLHNVSVQEALNHPNWQMGKKVSIDSATMMNKGLEAIAAQWLFELQPNQIDFLLHPQSVVHAIVQFADGSMKAQLGFPDMKLPIQYALTFPKRMKSDFPRLDLTQSQSLDLQAMNIAEYPCLSLAMQAMQQGGNMPCALNAANEVAVEAFLNQQIGFLQIAEVIEACLHEVPFYKDLTRETIMETDRLARERAKQIYTRHNKSH